MTLTSENKLLAAVILLTLIIRTAVVAVLGSALDNDPDAYRQIAANLLQHQTFGLSTGNGSEYVPTAYRPPLYPALLAGCSLDEPSVPPLRVAMLHIVLGTLTAALTFVVARQLTLTPQQAALAAMLVACDPILLNQSTLVMTETLATLLAVAALCCWLRLLAAPSFGRAAAVGASLGLAILCRPTFLPWAAALMGVLLVGRWLNQSPSGWSIRFSHFVVAFVWLAVVLLPWGVRNYLQCGRPILTTTHGGYTLLLANNDGFYEWLAQAGHVTPWNPAGNQSFERQLASVEVARSAARPSPMQAEIDRDVAFKNEAWATIRSRPRDCFAAAVYRNTQLWSPLPNRLEWHESKSHRYLRYLTAAWYCGLYLLAFAGIASLRRRLLQPAWLAGVLLCVSFMVVHSIYWCNLRMRAPLMPVVALVAAAGAGAIAVRLDKGRFAASPG